MPAIYIICKWEEENKVTKDETENADRIDRYKVYGYFVGGDILFIRQTETMRAVFKHVPMGGISNGRVTHSL